jgi:hypothetical protein
MPSHQNKSQRKITENYRPKARSLGLPDKETMVEKSLTTG